MRRDASLSTQAEASYREALLLPRNSECALCKPTAISDWDISMPKVNTLGGAIRDPCSQRALSSHVHAVLGRESRYRFSLGQLTLSVEASVATVTRVNPRNRFEEFSREETEQSIAERFEKQVRKYPHRIAIQTSHVQLTYNDLNNLANRLARVLLQQFPDDRPVAILMDHDAPAVAAIFGALKADKIFVLLDPALPDARIEQILSDSGSNSIVTNDKCFLTALDLLEGQPTHFQCGPLRRLHKYRQPRSQNLARQHRLYSLYLWLDRKA